MMLQILIEPVSYTHLEEYEDNFPIVIDENGNFSYTYDKNVSDYKEKNNIPSNLNAKETFYYLVEDVYKRQVLACSNVAISLLRKVIPDKIRIPAFVVVIATFVTIVQMLLKAYIPVSYTHLLFIKGQIMNMQQNRML